MMALVTGGAACGKSAYAERACTTLGGDLVYLAAMKPFGEEGAARVRKHRLERAGKGFRTIECYDGIDGVLAGDSIDGATVLLECLGNVVANELFRSEDAAPCSSCEISAADRVACSSITCARERILEALGALARRCAHLVIVGNEVGCDGIDYRAQTREYQELLGGIACTIAADADMVVECNAGVPIVLKRPDDADADGVALALSANAKEMTR